MIKDEIRIKTKTFPVYLRVGFFSIYDSQAYSSKQLRHDTPFL